MCRPHHRSRSRIATRVGVASSFSEICALASAVLIFVCILFFSCLIKLVKLFTCSVVVPSYTSHYYITVKFCCNAYQTRILYGRDGRTICGPLRVPKSTYVTLAHKRKQKFFYFGCSLVRRFCCKIKKTASDNATDGQTDRRTDRVRRNMRPPPREEGRIITLCKRKLYFSWLR